MIFIFWNKAVIPSILILSLCLHPLSPQPYTVLIKHTPGGVMTDTPATQTDFPPHPVVAKPSWMRSMLPSSRQTFEQNRQNGIERDVPTLVRIIQSIPGFENVPLESVTYIATRWAITLADGFEEGMQAGIENEQEFTRLGRQQSMRFQASAISAGTNGIG